MERMRCTSIAFVPSGTRYCVDNCPNQELEERGQCNSETAGGLENQGKELLPSAGVVQVLDRLAALVWAVSSGLEKYYIPFTSSLTRSTTHAYRRPFRAIDARACQPPVPASCGKKITRACQVHEIVVWKIIPALMDGIAARFKQIDNLISIPHAPLVTREVPLVHAGACDDNGFHFWWKLRDGHLEVLLVFHFPMVLAVPQLGVAILNLYIVSETQVDDDGVVRRQ
eukprot:CAMPEP_0181381128 /NCGR_PEP_ID=MMETSP1106-20121128/19946_1 /TAXON_ID=81844 /ORGANISM="Mantoniella antarctica, Strain SL-175" /LENGTH=226 /DNA_ID=CAMNT_0023500271 /DNA_START=112 /DNA_END=794 /DNA_ORIENTATION=-